MTLTYEITDTGYRILNDGVVWIVQEGQYANIYPGDTFEEKAKKHIEELKQNNINDLSYNDIVDIYNNLNKEEKEE